MAHISVIVPVYKVEKYIERCIESILKQTYWDFELILVDDGSPDASGAICDRYAAADSRIHVIHQKNGGVASARNAGIDWAISNSISEWLHFIDSDDWVHPQILERLLAVAEKYGTDISVCHYCETDGVTIEEIQTEEDSECTPESLFVDENVLSVVPWAKLYRKKCFAAIRYPENRYAEDEFITYKILFAEPRIAKLEARLYYYLCNSDGLSKIKWDPRRLDGLDALEEQLKFFETNGFRKAFEMIACAYADHLLNHLRMIEETELTAEEKMHYRKNLRKRLQTALWRYGFIYVHQHRGIYVELYPKLTAVYRSVKRLIKTVIRL